mgnify:CR=1 FL=1
MPLSDNFNKSLPLKRISPPFVLPFAASSRKIDNEVILFPEPDSPTIPIVFPFGTVKLTESLPIEVYKNLFYNEKSDYFTKENSVSGFDVYQAYTDIICNGKSKDLVNRFEKTLLVSRIIGI